MSQSPAKSIPDSIIEGVLSTSDVLDVVAIIDAVDVGVVFYDQRGTVIDINDVAAQFVGGSKESVIGATAKVQARFSVKRDGTRFSAAELPVVVALEERRPVKFDILGFDLFAHPRKWLRGTVAPVFVPGVVEGAVALYLDITSR